MDRSQLCGCKGVRTCFICEKEYNLTPTVDSTSLKVNIIKIIKIFVIMYLFENFVLETN